MAENQNTSLPPIIEFKNIRQAYLDEETNKEFVVFEDFNLSLPDYPDIGQFIVIMGKSGCGKSTLLRYATGIQKPTSGQILIQGSPITSDVNIPMVFQRYSSLEWMSVIDNVALPLRLKGVSKKEARAAAIEMVKIVGLEGHENKFATYPQLSGGQLQRVAIARCLVANPAMMLLDEPFGALDASTRIKLQFFLLDIFKKSEISKLNPTIILVTHDPKEAVLLGQDIYLLDSGKIVSHIRPELPVGFDKSIRKDPKFTEIVCYIEDALEGITSTDLNCKK